MDATPRRHAYTHDAAEPDAHGVRWPVVPPDDGGPQAAEAHLQLLLDIARILRERQSAAFGAPGRG
jgi:hypothetical protein